MPAGTTKYPEFLDDDSSIPRIIDNLFTYLTATLAVGVDIAHVNSTSGWPDKGIFYCGDEKVYYDAKTSDTFTSLTRGFGNTNVTEHQVNSTIRSSFAAEYLTGIAEAIKLLEAKLGKGAFLPINPGDVLTVNAEGFTVYQAPSVPDLSAYATNASLANYQTRAEKNAANGYLGLDVNSQYDLTRNKFLGCKLTHSADQPCVTGGAIDFTWDTEIHDTDGYHSSANPTRGTAPRNGYYESICVFAVEADLSGNRTAYMRLKKTSDSFASQTFIAIQTLAGFSDRMFMVLHCPLVYMFTGDYIEIRFTHSSTATLTIKAMSAFNGFGTFYETSPYFFMRYLGA